MSTFNVASIRSDFPILQTTMRGKPLIYLDNAASTQKPTAVIEAMREFYSYQYSNVHRGIYALSEIASERFEQARSKVQHFIHANQKEEIVFTRGTTEAINLVAQSYLKPRLQPKDEILLSEVEHHANIVPWQQLCDQTGAVLRWIPVEPNGELQWSCLAHLMNANTRLIAITHISNVLGIINPLKDLIQKAHEHNIPVLVDGAQAVGHLPVHVTELDCDFYAFSAHKMYGPNAIGVLYAKMTHLEGMPPWQGGGGMISRVSFEKTEYALPPHRFEAGTPAIAEAIGLGVTIDYLEGLDKSGVMQHETALFQYMIEKLHRIPGINVLGEEATSRIGVASITMDKVHPHDVATFLSEEGIAVRAGHHCAMPLMSVLKVPATTRISLGVYNTFEEIDHLSHSLSKIAKVFSQ